MKKYLRSKKTSNFHPFTLEDEEKIRIPKKLVNIFLHIGDVNCLRTWHKILL